MAVLDMGENLTLKCSAGQLQNKTTSLEWEKHYVSIATNRSFIHIVNSTWKDAGKYTCGVFHQSNLTLCSFLVKVRSPPHIKFGLYDGKYGVFKLPCYAKGYFKPDWVKWYKDDVQILSNSSEFEILNRNIDKNLYESSLLKNYPNISDTGKYSCEAGNVYGKSKKLHFHLSKRTILGYHKYPCPRFNNEQTERNVTIDTGSSKSIICKVFYHKYDHNRAKFVMFKKINASLFPILPNQDNMSVFTIEKKESRDAMVYLMNLTFINSTASVGGTFFCAVIMSGNPECENLYKQFNVKVITHDVKSTKKRTFNLKLVLIVSIWDL
ncbi:titin-like isoform X2 [Xenia sp. Carnegie-2017]|nr:titin-like isoform X2 [Xenia sp. Carnegie-2017]